MTIANTIRAARLRANMKKADLARALKVAPSAVSQWESGDTEPSVDNRVVLSSVLGIPIIDLMPNAEREAKTVSLNPQELMLLDKFQQLPPPMRDTYLRILMVQLDSLKGD